MGLAEFISWHLKEALVLGEQSNKLPVCYLHQNGFIKTVFEGLDSDFEEVRIHAWSGQKDDCSDIHNHTSSFHSLVVLGEITEQIFEPSDDGDEYFRYRCTTLKSGADVGLAFEGKQRLACTTSKTIKANSEYRIAADSFHRVLVASGTPTITLVGKNPRRRGYTNVFSRGAIADSVRGGNMLSPSDVINHLKSVVIAVPALRCE